MELAEQAEHSFARVVAGSGTLACAVRTSLAVGAMFVGPALVWMSWNSWGQQQREKFEKDPYDDLEETASWSWPGLSTSTDASAELKAHSPASIPDSEVWAPELQVRSRDLSNFG